MALDKKRHRSHRIKVADLSHSVGKHTCPALIGEFPQLAAEYPIVFVKSEQGGEQGGELRSVAMLGVKPGRNLFWQNNRWQGAYIPSALRAHPFAMVAIEGQEGQFAICIDESSPSMAGDRERGESLFDKNGEQTEYLSNISNFLLELRMQTSLSNEFARYLDEKGLLEEQVVLVKLPGGMDHRLTGVFRVNERAVNRLPDQEFLALRKRGYLSAIYAHLGSLRQVNNLSRLYGQLSQTEGYANASGGGRG
ncbi:SapC family protein [Microbulbifer rhizosphaerae]|uniref:SapC protein n=1 Tax=Microbulbifer rhizosphaerae TaxID=1562603 RepID=A0A7W4WBD8_9GAMM|nr:hypothetical protein [Microbulbifer rhizosphaerae]